MLKDVRWLGVIFRTLLAVFAALAASRGTGGAWESSIYVSIIAGLTTAEASVAKLRT